MELSTISQLNPTSRNRILEAKVYRKWIAKSPPEMTPYAFFCILLDQEGNAIQANMALKDSTHFDTKLQMHMAYRISNFNCESTSRYQQTLPNTTSLRFGKCTTFESIPATGFPHHYFQFISYNQLESKLPKPDSTGKLQYPILTDYMGRLRSTGTVDNFGDPTTRQGARRKIEIENLNGHIVECTLWDEIAHHFGEADLNSMEQPVIIAVTSCRVSKYTEYQLTATSATYYYLNPRIPEAEEARTRFQVKYKDNPQLTICKSPYKTVEQDKRRNRFPLKTIMAQNPQSYKSVRFTVEATVTGINMHKDWYYISCHECNRPATIHEDNYSCLDHGLQPGPFYRYKFKGYITDSTATAPMTFFSPAANQLTQHSCSELVEKYKPADPKKIPTEILDAKGKQGIFQFHLNTFGKLTDLSLDAVYDIQNQEQASETSSSVSTTVPQATESKQLKETPPSSPSRVTTTNKTTEQSTTQRQQPTKRTLFTQQSTDPKKQKEG